MTSTPPGESKQPWTCLVYGQREIYFYNSLKARSGPWSYDSQAQSITTGDYGTCGVTGRLAENLAEALRGDLPKWFIYDTDDIIRPEGD